jgi:hypothetical protein
MTDELAELEGKNEMNKMPGFTAEAALDRAHTHYSTAQFPRAQSEDGSGEIKAAQAGCTVLRPIGWNQFGVGCVEGPTTPMTIRSLLKPAIAELSTNPVQVFVHMCDCSTTTCWKDYEKEHVPSLYRNISAGEKSEFM